MADERRMTASEFWNALASTYREPEMVPAGENPAGNVADIARSVFAAMAKEHGNSGPQGTSTNMVQDSSRTPPPMAASAPATAVPMERPGDVLSRSRDEIHDKFHRAGLDPYGPRGRAIRRDVRTEFEAAMRNRRIKLGG